MVGLIIAIVFILFFVVLITLSCMFGTTRTSHRHSRHRRGGVTISSGRGSVRISSGNNRHHNHRRR